LKWPKRVKIKEVGPRDGLQNEEKILSADDKAEWINRLSETGLVSIEVSSFVNPKWIPQLADASEVFSKIKRKKGIKYAALVPNIRGLERALEADVDEVCLFMSASETHNQKNINKSISETFPVLEEVVKEAKSAGKTVRGYVSTVIACPYEGAIPISSVKKIVECLLEMGVDEVSLGDTIGAGVPSQVEALLSELLKSYKAELFAMHFHDTRGTALANILLSMQMGITTFDSSLGGLGGCPYADGATGNVATEDLLYMLMEMGIETGIDMDRLLQAAHYIEEKLEKPLASRQMELARRTRKEL